MRFSGQRARAIASILVSRVSLSRSIGRTIMASAAEDAKKMMKLCSSEWKEFVVEEAAVKQSEMIAEIIEEGCPEEAGTPVLNVTSKVFAKVLVYLKKHADFAAGKPSGQDGAPVTKEEIAAWDAEYINVEQDVLYDIIFAANYLRIKSLLDLCCERAAAMIRGRTPAEIREWFKIPMDFSAEDMREVRREQTWAFD